MDFSLSRWRNERDKNKGLRCIHSIFKIFSVPLQGDAFLMTYVSGQVGDSVIND